MAWLASQSIRSVTQIVCRTQMVCSFLGCCDVRKTDKHREEGNDRVALPIQYRQIDGCMAWGAEGQTVLHSMLCPSNRFDLIRLCLHSIHTVIVCMKQPETNKLSSNLDRFTLALTNLLMCSTLSTIQLWKSNILWVKNNTLTDTEAVG